MQDNKKNSSRRALGSVPARALTAASGPQVVWSRFEIIRTMRRLLREEKPVAVEFGADDRMFVSRLLKVDPRHDQLTLAYGDHRQTNSALLRASGVVFTVTEKRILTRFASHGVQDVVHANAAAFRIGLPEAIVYTDRRESERVSIPAFHMPSITIRSPEFGVFRGQLADISHRGVGIIALPGDCVFPEGAKFFGCIIQVDRHQGVAVDLQLRYVREFPLPDGTTTRRCGFRLLSTPPELETIVRSFVVRLAS